MAPTNIPIRWKQHFVPLETIIIKGLPFTVMSVGKRGLALRRGIIKNENRIKSRPALAALPSVA
jgi:hypothetical protein